MKTLRLIILAILLCISSCAASSAIDLAAYESATVYTACDAIAGVITNRPGTMSNSGLYYATYMTNKEMLLHHNKIYKVTVRVYEGSVYITDCVKECPDYNVSIVTCGNTKVSIGVVKSRYTDILDSN